MRPGRRAGRTRRYLVYSNRKAADFLCVVTACNKFHALKVARQEHELKRGAYAKRQPEGSIYA